MVRTAALALAALTLAACGQPILYAKIDTPSVAVTQTFDFVGVPAPADPTVETLFPEKGFTLDFGSLDLPTQATQDSFIKLNGLRIALLSPPSGSSFAALRSARIRVVPPPGSALAPVEIATYVASRDGPVTDWVAFAPAGDVDLLPYVEAKQLTLQLAVVGTPPGPSGTPLSADVTLDMHLLAQIHVH